MELDDTAMMIATKVDETTGLVSVVTSCNRQWKTSIRDILTQIDAKANSLDVYCRVQKRGQPRVSHCFCAGCEKLFPVHDDEEAERQQSFVNFLANAKQQRVATWRDMMASDNEARKSLTDRLATEESKLSLEREAQEYRAKYDRTTKALKDTAVTHCHWHKGLRSIRVTLNTQVK